MKRRIFLFAIGAPMALYFTWQTNKDKSTLEVLSLVVGGFLFIYVFSWAVNKALKVLSDKDII